LETILNSEFTRAHWLTGLSIGRSGTVRSYFVLFLPFVLSSFVSCRNDPLSKLYGRWEGKTKFDQDISITLNRDSTIEIETQTDEGRQIRTGTYRIVDRRIRIALTTLEIHSGNTVKREKRIDQDEAVFTMTGKDEMVLREGTQAIILRRIGSD